MRIIDRFSSEHDVFITQLDVIGTLTPTGAEVPSVVAAIRTPAAPLHVHAQNEERALFVLFPAAAQLIEDARPRRLDREIRAVVLAR